MNTRMRSPVHLLLILVLWGCGTGAPVPATPALAPAEIRISDPLVQVARSPAGMVSSASVFATEVGARVLAQGGNAVDAAVATGFALAVTEPSMSGIAGRASIVIRTPGGVTHGIDGLNAVPSGFRDGGSPGYERAAVPGVLAALTRAQADHGSWPLERVMAPAIRLAREGFVLSAEEAGRFAGAADDLREHPGSRAAFLKPGGTPYEAGDLFVQPELARVLEAVQAEGPDVFYRGWIADSIHADMSRNGGFITREDLAGYQALDAIPVRGSYRGHAVVSNFRPASGHAVIQALQTLEEVSGSEALLRDDAAWAGLVGQAMHHALQDRNRREGSEAASAAFLTSRSHARTRAGELRVPRIDAPGTGAGPGAAVDPPPADRSPAVAEPWRAGGVPATIGTGPGAMPETPVLAATTLAGATTAGWTPGVLVTDPADRESTTHYSVADASGMVVAITQSLGPSMGTRVVSAGLGFLYATRLGSEPASRPSSTIAPTLVLGPDGEPAFALGGAGDARIISAVIQVISRRIDQGMTLEQALAAPRVHPINAAELRIEEGSPSGEWMSAQRGLLAGLGLELSTSPPGYFGRVHAVEFTPDGLLGVAEPRWQGSAAGPMEPWR